MDSGAAPDVSHHRPGRDRDPQTTLDEAAAWKQHTSGAFELRDFAGGHFYLDAHRQGVADAVSRVLERVARPMETLGGNGR